MELTLQNFEDLQPGSLVRALCQVTGGHDCTAWGIKAQLESSDGGKPESGIFWISDKCGEKYPSQFELGFSGKVLFLSKMAQVQVDMGRSQLIPDLDQAIRSNFSGLIILDKPSLLGRAVVQRRNNHGWVVCSFSGEIRRYLPGRPLHDGPCVVFPDFTVNPSVDGEGYFGY